MTSYSVDYYMGLHFHSAAQPVDKLALNIGTIKKIFCAKKKN